MTVEIGLELLAPLIAAAGAWGVQTHIRLRRLHALPKRVARIDRRTMRILMKVDPEAAQRELEDDPPAESDDFDE